MPPGFITPAASKAYAADLIRGRGALRTLPASAQTAGTAVSLLPPQNAAGNNLSLSLQAAHDRAQTSLANLRTMRQENMSNFQLTEISEGQQFILRSLCGQATGERPSRVVQEAVVPVVANEGIDSTATPPLQETAARPPKDSTSLVDTMSGAANTSSSTVPDMSTAERRAAWQAERDEARAQRKAESEAAARGESMPPVANPSPSMQLHLASLEARVVRQQRQAADILARQHFRT
jgi:hypothetical protein